MNNTTLTTLSIITVNLNNKSGLTKTINSVSQAKIPASEFIVIDGESTDGSVDIITNHKHIIDFWISEKDNGIYSAMNKGISISNGLYLMFLNSGDCVCDVDSINSLISFAEQSSHPDIVYGNISVVESLGRTWTRMYPANLTLDYFREDTINHQASLIKRSLFDEFGKYPESFRLASDFWLYLKAISHRKSFKYFDETVVVYDNNGISANNMQKYLAEKEAIWNELVPAEFQTILLENKELKNLTSSRFVKIGIKLSKFYNSWRNKF
ncbi:MAG: glycosyltransferase [Flavobacterium sp.]|nr:MAG: glycosyltransferase [Flavobacterium sp.]